MRWLDTREAVLRPISGAMGEGMGMGDPPGPPPPSPPPPPPPPPASPSGAVLGSAWVEGSALHWIDSTGVERSDTGSSQGSPAGAVVGSGYVIADIASTRGLFYVDASGVLRRFVGTVLSTKPPGATIGSAWVQGTQLRFVVDDAIRRV